MCFKSDEKTAVRESKYHLGRGVVGESHSKQGREIEDREKKWGSAGETLVRKCLMENLSGVGGLYMQAL